MDSLEVTDNEMNEMNVDEMLDGKWEMISAGVQI